MIDVELDVQQREQAKQEQIKAAEELILYFRDLALSAASQDGQKILTEINSQLNDLNNYLAQTAMQPLTPPYYEYEKSDLQLMKAIRAKQEAVTILIESLQPSALQKRADELTNLVEKLKKGEAIEPSYDTWGSPQLK